MFLTQLHFMIFMICNKLNTEVLVHIYVSNENLTKRYTLGNTFILILNWS
jgi:hypothetical protein